VKETVICGLGYVYANIPLKNKWQKIAKKVQENWLNLLKRICTEQIFYELAWNRQLMSVTLGDCKEMLSMEGVDDYLQYYSNAKRNLTILNKYKCRPLPINTKPDEQVTWLVVAGVLSESFGMVTESAVTKTDVMFQAPSPRRTSYVAIRFHRRVWYRALSLLRYACARSSGIILIPRLHLCQISFLLRPPLLS